MHPSKQRAAAHPLAAYLLCFDDVSITELVCLGLPYLNLQRREAQFSLLLSTNSQGRRHVLSGLAVADALKNETMH